jgi:hypothetical protein
VSSYPASSNFASRTPSAKGSEKAPFFKIYFGCQQIAYVNDIAESQSNIPISINALARTFDCQRNRVKAALEHDMEPPGHQGKHSAIDDEYEQHILAWIQESAETSTPVTKTEIKDYCTREFQVAVTRGWVNSFVLRHAEEIIPTKRSPQDEQRLQVPRVLLARTIQELNEHVKGCIAELVFNLDEVGISDWENRKPRKVIVPATMTGHTIHHGVSRNVRHISIIACVPAAGESITPYVVTYQGSPVVCEQLKSTECDSGWIWS